MRQGIVVTALLAVFVAVAMLFIGGASLFAMPPSSSGATAHAVDAPSPAHRTAERIAAGKVASAGMADTLALLHWLSTGLARLDLGKGHSAQFGFAALTGRATAAAEPAVPFGIPASASDFAPAITLAADLQPYTVAAVPPQAASYSEAPVSSAAPPAVAEPERDRTAASLADVERFTAAAAGGDLNAKYKLGVMYRDGKGVARDPVAAAHWLLAAAKGGNPLAESAIGAMYDSGTGVARDPTAAYMWLDLAASRSTDASDRNFASTERDRVAAGMSEAELAAARRLVSDQISVISDQKAPAGDQG